jgi:hypothetical protein
MPSDRANFSRDNYWVTVYGTGGTLKGVTRILNEERPDTKIIVCEPFRWGEALVTECGIVPLAFGSGSGRGITWHHVLSISASSCRLGTRVSLLPL